jgi:hypothetical protein
VAAPQSFGSVLTGILLDYWNLEELYVARNSEDPTDEYLWAIEVGAGFRFGGVLGGVFADMVEAGMGNMWTGVPVSWEA